MKRKLGVNALLISHAERNAKPVDTLNVYKSLYTLKSIANALVRGEKKEEKETVCFCSGIFMLFCTKENFQSAMFVLLPDNFCRDLKCQASLHISTCFYGNFFVVLFP